MRNRIIATIAAFALASASAIAQAGERWIFSTKETLATSTGKAGKAVGILDLQFAASGNGVLVVWRSQRGGDQGTQDGTWSVPDPLKPRSLRIQIQETGNWFDEVEAWIESLHGFDPEVRHFDAPNMVVEVDISKPTAAKIALSHDYEWRDAAFNLHTMRLSMKGKGRQLIEV